jgi:hypothetical protein
MQVAGYRGDDNGHLHPAVPQVVSYLCAMGPTLLTILIAIGLLALAFAGIAIKIWGKKGGEFAGTCASNNPLVQKEGGSCGFCGARPEEQCKRE